MNNISWKKLQWWEAMAVVLVGMTSPAIGSQYFTDFEGSVGPEWSSQQTDVTPVGNRRFLGQFLTDTVSLSLTNLPAHQAVTIWFDLFVIASWDSDGNGGGPDVWDLRVASGPTLLHTTFSNTGGEDGFRNNYQAFPGNFPDEVHPARTGAVENNSLGFGPYGDAVYHLTFAFPHTADAVILNFSGQGLNDESWGLDNVRVDLLPTGDTSPVLIYQPHDLSAVAGNSAALSAPAYGTAPLQYQWRFDGTNLPGAATDILTLTNVQMANAGNYDVIVANNYGSVTSRVAVLSVEPPVYYVNVANPTPVFPYTTWETAATNIQDAIEAGTAAGRLVLVTNGVYATGGRAVEGSLLTNRVTILKPITVQSVNGPGATVIEGTAAPGGGDGNGAVRCLYLEANAVLSGFTLRNGHTRGAASGLHESEANGGGVWSGHLGTVINCVLVGNSANCGGGAFHSTLINCLLTGNSAAAGGGAGLSTLYNCTLTGNSASDGGGGATGCFGTEGALYNCIVYFNTAPNAPNSGGYYGDCTFQYSCTTPLPPGPGNIDADPLFVNRAAGDLHLRYGSPCIDAGTNLVALITTDLDGHPRPLDGNGDGIAAFDMGAYEISGTFEGGPIVVAQPASQEVLAGTTLDLSVQAVGAAPLAYQWQHDGVASSDGGRISGATSNRLEIAAVKAEDVGTYAVLVSNTYGSTNSLPAVVNVLFKPPEIITQPVSDYTWHIYGGHLYALTKSTGTWVDHEAEAVSLGGHLVTINSDAEDKWVATTFDNVNAANYDGPWGLLVDIGYYFNGTDNAWEWISGQPVTYTNLYSIFPEGGTHAYIHEASHPSPYTWNAAPYLTEPGANQLAYGVIEVEIELEGGPIVVAQPLSQEVLAGTTLDLSVWALGSAPLAYQWQHNGVALSDGGRISGATTNHLQIADAKTEDVGSYTVVVSNTYGSTNSVPAVISILLKPPEITTQPTNQTVLSGSSVLLRVGATGSLPMTYQWQRNEVALSDGGRIAGANTTNLRITDVNAEDMGIYTVVVSNSFGSTGSNPAVITILLRPPEITTQPTDQSVLSGSSISLSVTASSNLPVMYQWRLNGVDLSDEGRIAGAKTANLQITDVNAEDMGTYTVVVSNNDGSTSSKPAVITILFNPPEITTQPTDQSVPSGAPLSLSVTATGSLPITYQWQRNGVALSDGGRIAGAKTTTLTISAVGIDDVGVYSVMVGNTLGTVTSLPVTLDVVIAPPQITGQPQSQAAHLRSTVVFEVRATGSQPLTYHWQCNGIELVDGDRVSGAQTSILSMRNLCVADLAQYSVIVSNAYGWVQSGSVSLDIPMPAGDFTFEVLHHFGHTAVDGRNPWNVAIKATDGNFYGTTQQGGSETSPDKYGTVYRYNPGTLEYIVLQTLRGDSPEFLIQGSDGYIYGVTVEDGEYNKGSVYQLDPRTGELTTLHSFDGTDGYSPYASVMEASDGWLYGTTFEDWQGTMFRIRKDGSGFELLYRFGDPGGRAPIAPLIEASDGFLYSTTATGGGKGWGTIFRFDRVSKQLTTLYAFSVETGEYIESTVLEGAGGRLFGTTRFGGNHGKGVIYSIDKDGQNYVVHHHFGDVEGDGLEGVSKLILGEGGKFYGTTYVGGKDDDAGVVYEFDPSNGAYRIIHDLAGPSEGSHPWAGVVYADGSLYGTTTEGGQYGGGTLFRLASQSDLVIEADVSQALLSWKETARGMKLQQANSLTNPDWHEVPGSDLTNRVTVPLGEGNAFFRLVKP